MSTITQGAAAWLLTYAIHSTLILGFMWFFLRRPGVSALARDVMWKSAVLGAIVTTTLQTQLDLRPAGSMTLAASARAAGPRAREDGATADIIEVKKDDNGKSIPGSEVQVQSSTASVSTPDTTGSSVSLTGVLVAVWATLGLLMSLGFVARRLILVGRLGDRRPVTEGALPTMLDSLRRSSGHRGAVVLTSSTTISSPVALGLGEICVPDAALTHLSVDEQRSLLAHELAHLARRDPLWLDAIGILERLFFFQPLNRVARRELQRDAEFLCDDWAAERTGGGEALAHCLAHVAEWIQASPLGVPVAGMAEQRSLLVSRIARLIEGRAVSGKVARPALVVGSLLLLAGALAAAPGVHSTPPAPKALAAADTARSPEVSAVVHEKQGAQEEPAQDTGVVRALIERLKDTDAGVRKAAAGSLGRLKARRAVPALISALDDRDREVRGTIAETLGEMGDDRAASPLTDLLKDSSSDVRQKALEALSHYSKQVSAGPVIAVLRDGNAEVRARAAQLLSEIRDPAAVPALTKALSDPIADVRIKALEGLKEIRDPSAAPEIVALLKDPNADVRHEALHALHEMKVPVGEKVLLDALTDQSADVRSTAAEIIGSHPFAAAIPALKALLDDSNSDVREAAVDALGEINSPAARDALRVALTSRDPNVRRKATEALGGKP